MRFHLIKDQFISDRAESELESEDIVHVMVVLDLSTSLISALVISNWFLSSCKRKFKQKF